MIVAGQVYTFGARGMLHCLQLASGKKIWSVDTTKEFAVRKGFFGAASTPLVEGNRLFLNVGGEGAGHLAAVRLDEAPGAADQALRLRVEEAGGSDDLLELGRNRLKIGRAHV